MIPFSVPLKTGLEEKYIKEALNLPKISGDGYFTKKCIEFFNTSLKSNTFLTTSCTHALEMSALLIDIKEGDEVIMPSFTFVSTANAFVLFGAKIVFVDIRPDTLNIDESKIEEAITSKTKAIVPVHYAGVGCDMDTICKIAKKHNLYVIEDAAQGVMSSYKDRPLGTVGDIGTFSFHDTKNYTSGGEGGLLIINNKFFLERAEIIREKGTNRSKFLNGLVDKYTWVDIGSSYLPNEISAAYLYGNIQKADDVNKNRLKSWDLYFNGLKSLEDEGCVNLPIVPLYVKHNAHMFYIKVENINIRTELIKFLKDKGINSSFHYVPLHSSPAGIKFGRFNGEDYYTTIHSEQLLRLPLFYNMTEKEIDTVIFNIYNFFKIEYN